MPQDLLADLTHSYVYNLTDKKWTGCAHKWDFYMILRRNMQATICFLPPEIASNKWFLIRNKHADFHEEILGELKKPLFH